MADARLLLKNTAALGIASIANRAITAIVGILVTRYLGPESFGQYSAAYAFVNMFILLTELGISQLMVQEGSRDPKVLSVYLGNTLVFKAVVGALVYAAMVLIMGSAGYDQTIQMMILLLGVGSAFSALNASIYNYFQAKQEMYRAAGYQFLYTFLIGAFTLVVIFAGGSVVTISVIHLAVAVLLTAILYYVIRKDTPLRIDFKQLPTMLKNGLAFGIARMFYNVYFQIGILMLSLMVSTIQVGIFSAAYRLVSILIFIPSILTSVIYPVLFQLGVTDKGKHRETIEKFFKVLSAVGIPGSFLIFVMSESIISWLYGSRFPESVPILRLLAWFFMLECLSFSLGDVLTTTNRQWTRTVIQGGAAAVNVVLNLVLIPAYGIYGAAYGTLITEALILLAYYVVVRRKVYQIRVMSQLPVILMASLAMGGTAYLLRSAHPVLTALAAGIVYLVVLIGFDSDFRRIGRYILRQRH